MQSDVRLLQTVNDKICFLHEISKLKYILIGHTTKSEKCNIDHSEKNNAIKTLYRNTMEKMKKSVKNEHKKN